MTVTDEIIKRLTAKMDENKAKAQAARTRFNYKDAEMYTHWSSTLAEALIVVHGVLAEHFQHKDKP
jgi:hypothetical protein